MSLIIILCKLYKNNNSIPPRWNDRPQHCSKALLLLSIFVCFSRFRDCQLYVTANQDHWPR